jgi:hypothetical protein
MWFFSILGSCCPVFVPKTAFIAAMQMKFDENFSKDMERFAGKNSRFSMFGLARVGRNWT